MLKAKHLETKLYLTFDLNLFEQWIVKGYFNSAIIKIKTKKGSIKLVDFVEIEFRTKSFTTTVAFTRFLNWYFG